MPQPKSASRGILCLCILLAITTLILVMLPLETLAGYNINLSGDGPGGDGQPDDIGNAPRPSILGSIHGAVSFWGQWMKLWISQVGFGGLFS